MRSLDVPSCAMEDLQVASSIGSCSEDESSLIWDSLPSLSKDKLTPS